MSNPEYSIPLEKATREELLKAVLSEFPLSNVRERMEKAVFWNRINALQAEARKLIDALEDARHQPGEAFNPSKRERFTYLMEKLELINRRQDRMMSPGKTAT